MLGQRITETAHGLILPFLGEGDTVVDATAGNGYDTLFLAEQIGEKGTIYAFDIQRKAIEATQRKLSQYKGNVHLIQTSHGNMAHYIPEGKVACIVFNLGYLPGADHTLTTKGDSTVAAMEAGVRLLKPGGVMQAVIYYGHPGGDEEKRIVLKYLTELPHKWLEVVQIEYKNRPNHPPIIVNVLKKE